MRTPKSLAISFMLIAACGQAAVPIDDVPLLESTTPGEIRALLDSSQQPVVVNVWASWCVPCRSEAPLLREAAAAHGDTVRFIGIDVRDSQNGARAFIAEFGLAGLEHYFDPSGAVPGNLGGRGVPITFFFAAGGELLITHHGVIDERTLALRIDDLLQRVEAG